MLKKFNTWLVLENKYDNNSFVNEEINYSDEYLLSEAVQGNVVKETIPHLFSDDTIKYLYQFDPDDHAQAEYQRYQILYDAMSKRQEYYNKFISETENEEKENLKRIFEKQKTDLGIGNIGFSKDFETTIINHCARKNAFEKVNKEKLKEWWDSDDPDGGKQYLKNNFEINVEQRKGIYRKYFVNLYLKEMVNRIEKSPAASSGSDLSYPHERNTYTGTGRIKKVKRFSGMLLPDVKTLSSNIDLWKSAIANNMLAVENPKHEGEHSIRHIKSLLGGESGIKEKIRYKDTGKENRELFVIERVILSKELRDIFFNKSFNSYTKKIYDAYKSETDEEKKKNLYEDLKHQYNLFIKDFIRIFPFALKIYNELPSALKDEKFDDVYKPLNNPQAFFDKVADYIKTNITKFSWLAYRVMKDKDDKKKEDKKKEIKYDDVFDNLKKEFALLLYNNSLGNSFIKLIPAMQLIDWIKEGNIKSINPIDGTTVSAKIEGETLKLPNIYMPTFEKAISFKYKVGTKDGKDIYQEISKNVTMPLLMPGKVLKEKSRFELNDEDGPSDTGAGMWSPYHNKFKKRYFDRTDDRFAGMQGQEDKLRGGLSPNHNIESYNFLCPSSDDKPYDPNSFWNRVRKIVQDNGNLSKIIIHQSPNLSKLLSKETSIEEKKDLYPKIEFIPIRKATSSDNVVVQGIAEKIWNSLKQYSVMDAKKVDLEKLVLSNWFMWIYHLIFAKIIQNIGDIAMTDTASLKKFINDKVQLITQKNIIEKRGARTTRDEMSSLDDDAAVEKVADEDEFEDESEVEEKDSLPTAVIEKLQATGSIDKYVHALEAYALHTCKKGEDIIACKKCIDPIDGKCEIYMNADIYHSDAEFVIESLKFYKKEVEKKQPKLTTPKPASPFRTLSVPTTTPIPATTPASTIITRTPAPVVKPTEIPIPAIKPAGMPAPSVKPSGISVPATVPSIPKFEPEITSEKSAAKVPESEIIKNMAPEMQEHLLDIQSKIIKKLSIRLLAKLENDKIELANKKREDILKAAEEDFSNLSQIRNSLEKQYESLANQIDEDYVKINAKLVSMKNLDPNKSFEDFVLDLCKINNWKDILDGIK